MAFKVNSSDKKVVGGGLYTGVANVKVNMINPTKVELEAKGMQPQKEPEYLTKDNNGVEKLLLQFYMYKEFTLPNSTTLEKIYPKRAFWIENKVRTNKEGNKYEWINKFGVTAWSTSSTEAPNYDWFKKEGARPALVGEAKLTKFIKAWANVDLNDQATLDNPVALAKGDLSEIKGLFAMIPGNEVQVLLGVNITEKGNYQDVYDGHFERATNKDFTRWQKELAKDGQEFKSDFQGDLKFKEYTGSSTVAQDTATNLDVPGSSAPTGGGIPTF